MSRAWGQGVVIRVWDFELGGCVQGEGVWAQGKPITLNPNPQRNLAPPNPKPSHYFEVNEDTGRDMHLTPNPQTLQYQRNPPNLNPKP